MDVQAGLEAVLTSLGVPLQASTEGSTGVAWGVAIEVHSSGRLVCLGLWASEWSIELRVPTGAAYSFADETAIDLKLWYRFPLVRLPADALITPPRLEPFAIVLTGGESIADPDVPNTIKTTFRLDTGLSRRFSVGSFYSLETGEEVSRPAVAIQGETVTIAFWSQEPIADDSIEVWIIPQSM